MTLLATARRRPTNCQWCEEPLPAPRAVGRTREFCSRNCRLQSFRFWEARGGRPKPRSKLELLAELAGACVGVAEGLIAVGRLGVVPPSDSLNRAGRKVSELKRRAAELGLIEAPS